MPEPVGVPSIRTERLLLRPWRDEDLDAYAPMCSDPEVMRHLGGPLDRVQTWRQIALFAGHWQLRGYGVWAAERRDDGALVGRLGLWNPVGWPGLEVGWALAREYWGAGYATEGARATIEWAWSVLGVDELISVIAPDNDASIRVAGRLGMSALRETELNDHPVTIYGLARADR